MATIYFDTEARQYCALVWSRARTDVTTSDDPILGRAEEGTWSCILPYLGQEAPNMRKVSSYFCHPQFRHIYEMTRLPFDQAFSPEQSIRFMRRDIQSNYGYRHLNPNQFGVTASEDSDGLKSRLQYVNSLSTIAVFHSNHQRVLAPDAYRIVKKMLVFRSDAHFDLIMNQILFPVLQKLYFSCSGYGITRLNGLSETKGVAMTSLRSLLIKHNNNSFCNFDGRSLEQILLAAPYLERIRFYLQIDDRNGPFQLKPLSLVHLKELCLNVINQNQFQQFLSAAPNVQRLYLGSHLKIDFSRLEMTQSTNLQELSFTWVALTDKDLSALLGALPQLRRFHLRNTSYVRVNNERFDIPSQFYPSIKEVQMTTTRNGCNYAQERAFVTSMMPFIEHMPNLETLHFNACDVVKARVTEASAYRELRHLTLEESSSMQGAYINDMLKAASRVQKVDIPAEYWDEMEDLPDGYLSELTEVPGYKQLSDSQKEACYRIAPQLAQTNSEGDIE